MSASLRRLLAALLVAGIGSFAPNAAMPQQMPDPSLIHGRALPAPELPDATVTVRVVRESIGNDAPNQTVRVTVGGAARTATTDAQGRAEFKGLPAGQEGIAESTVDGEAMRSEPFTVPATGGLRVILVAGIAKAAERRAAEAAAAAAAPAAKGVVVFGGNSRVLMQFTDDVLQVFYVLDVVNNARTRVDIGGPLVITLPTGAGGATKLEGSAQSATVEGDRVTIEGPFAAGTTSVQVAYSLPFDGGSVEFAQTWPAALQQVTVGVERVAGLSVASPQFVTTNDVRTDDGTVFALGTGPGLPAGGTLRVSLGNLPHHSRTSRYVALGLAGLVLLAGVWLAVSASTDRVSPRALSDRREALFRELEELEGRRQRGEISAERFSSRRRRLVTELEQVYGEIDRPAGPQGGGEGVAA